MQAGERQVAPSIDGIREDHRARYEWAADLCADGENQNKRVLDVGCGVGYGSWIMAKRGHNVHAFDVDAEAITYANEHYTTHWARFRMAAAGDWLYDMGHFDAAVCFEMIEHLEDPAPLLRGLREVSPVLLASVPNEERFPYIGYKFHFRHYTRLEFDELLAFSGWQVVERWGQDGPQSPVEREVNGRTYVVKAIRSPAAIVEKPRGVAWPTMKAKAQLQLAVVEKVPPALADVSNMSELIDTPRSAQAAPGSVCILGCGPSLDTYVHNARTVGSRRALFDEVWAVNVLGDILQCDRIFHMDDVRVQEIRAVAAPQSNIANMVKWLKTHPGPIYTSVPHPDYPGTVAFPLEDVLNSTGLAYFNSTVAYAVAYAVHIGVKRIALYGCDFTYPDAHQAEKGRACLEYWMGFAQARGVVIQVAATSTLLDAREPTENRFYGYDGVTIRNVGEANAGKFKLAFDPKELPTAEQIEERYDHDRHPNSLVEESKGG